MIRQSDDMDSCHFHLDNVCEKEINQPISNIHVIIPYNTFRSVKMGQFDGLSFVKPYTDIAPPKLKVWTNQDRTQYLCEQWLKHNKLQGPPGSHVTGAAECLRVWDMLTVDNNSFVDPDAKVTAKYIRDLLVNRL